MARTAAASIPRTLGPVLLALGPGWLLILGVPSFFLGLIASQAGWLVAEVGRQPWAIQDMLPVHVSATDIAATNVQITFFMFMFIFTLLLIAEIGIMLKTIKKGPEGV